MISQQIPLNTPFTAASTATEVLEGIDLTAKQVIVTGGHGRLGREVTRALGSAGANVTVASRDTEKAAAAVEGIARVQVEQLDLTDPESVEAFAQRWLDSERPLHILVNSAAVLFGPLRRDARGHELQFSTAHLGHFQLTQALLPALRASGAARVVNVTSGAARFGEILWDDVDFATTDYDGGVAYGQSKRANVLFTVELDRRYADEGIRAFAAHPGVIIGPGPHSPERIVSFRAQGLVDENGDTIIDPVGGKKTIEQGAANLVFGATSPLLNGIGGVYLKDNDVSFLDDEQRPLNATSIPSEANSAMLNPTDARRLWDLTESLLAS